MSDPEATPGGPVDEREALPRWFRMSVIGGLAITAVVHLFVDIAIDSYEGTGLSFLLFGGVGSAVAGNEWWANRRSTGDTTGGNR